jgi:hypothetical protein
MAQTATLHIKIEPAVARGLKQVAGHRRVTVGELVRQAVQTCYQTEWLGLTAAQRQALEAYRGEYISLGRLAETLGLTPLKAREWLNERGIIQNTVYAKDDLAHA